MKVFLGNFVICFLMLMFTVELLINNIWIGISAGAVVLAAIISVLYFQQEKIDALEKRIEQMEKR